MADKLHALTAEGTEHDVDNYKLLLAYAASGLALDPGADRRGPHNEALATVLDCLGRLHPTGLAWRDPAYRIPDTILRDLRKEARGARATARPDEGHFVAETGPIADALAESDELVSIAAKVDPDAGPSGGALYLYYEDGAGGKPHVDTDFFTLTGMVMVDDSGAGEAPSSRSRLVVLEADGSISRFAMEPGEVVFFWGGSTVHGREPVPEGGGITVLITGFRPAE